MKYPWPAALVLALMLWLGFARAGSGQAVPDIYLLGQPFSAPAHYLEGHLMVPLESLLAGMGRGWRLRDGSLEVLNYFDPRAPRILEPPREIRIGKAALHPALEARQGVIYAPLAVLVEALGARVLNNAETGILDVVVGRPPSGAGQVTGQSRGGEASAGSDTTRTPFLVASQPYSDLGEEWVQVKITNQLPRRSRTLWVRCSFLDDYGRETYGDVRYIDPLEPGQSQELLFHWRDSILIITPYHIFKHRITLREMNF